MTRIYIVMSGSYDDYSISAVFSTEEKAINYIAKMREAQPDSYVIERFDIDEKE